MITLNKTVVEENRLLFYFTQKSGGGSDALFHVIGIEAVQMGNDGALSRKGR